MTVSYSNDLIWIRKQSWMMKISVQKDKTTRDNITINEFPESNAIHSKEWPRLDLRSIAEVRYTPFHDYVENVIGLHYKLIHLSRFPANTHR